MKQRCAFDFSPLCVWHTDRLPIEAQRVSHVSIDIRILIIIIVFCYCQNSFGGEVFSNVFISFHTSIINNSWIPDLDIKHKGFRVSEKMAIKKIQWRPRRKQVLPLVVQTSIWSLNIWYLILVGSKYSQYLFLQYIEKKKHIWYVGSEIFWIFVPAISGDILYAESDFRVVEEKGLLISAFFGPVDWKIPKQGHAIVLYVNNTASKPHRHLQP